jgi:hypothetical protein
VDFCGCSSGMLEHQDVKTWAEDLVAEAAFGNRRREVRCAKMLRRVAENPSGRLTAVFRDAAELQAAYDFVEGSVPAEAMLDAFAAATLKAAEGDEFVFAVIDGTSLSLTDRCKTKGFGSVGKRSLPTAGLKVIDSIAVASDGTPLGLLDMQFWARGARSKGSRATRRRHGETEVRYWSDGIHAISERMQKAGIRPWLLIDREGDCSQTLLAAERARGYFTVRAAQYKRLCQDGKRPGSLLKAIGRRPALGTHYIAVPRAPQRRERVAVADVRMGRVALMLPNRATGTRVRFDTNVVWVRERRAPRGEKPLDWMLFTNRPIESYAAAIEIIDSYCHRWRIEDFHRSWKRGHCHVEETQLREKDHVVRWSLMLAAVAVRVERLKHLARSQPDAPATVELRPVEIEALKAAKRTSFLKRTETVPDGVPTIATAVFWIAQWGGFQGKTSATAGSTTIGRGLERLLVFALGFEHGLKTARK